MRSKYFGKISKLINYLMHQMHPCCGDNIQSSIVKLALFDMVWTFLRTIYHMNDLLTTLDSWLILGKIPHFGLLSTGILAYFVVLYAAYFGMALILMMASHKQDPLKCILWIKLATYIVTIQISVLIGSIVAGHFIHFVQEEISDDEIPETYVVSLKNEYLVLKLPMQGISLLGSFYTVYEVWVVKYLIEFLKAHSSDSEDYKDSNQ